MLGVAAKQRPRYNVYAMRVQPGTHVRSRSVFPQLG